MSDELISSYKSQIAELDKRKMDLTVALRDERRTAAALKKELETYKSGIGVEADKLKADLASLTAERDALKLKVDAAPTEKDQRILELETSLRTRDHRDAWRDAVGSELQKGATIEEVWNKVGYKPDGDGPDPAKLTDLVTKAKESAGYLFVPPDAGGTSSGSNGASQRTTRTQLRTEDNGASRGARDDTSGHVAYRRSEVQQPGWMATPRGKQILEARSAGTAVEVAE